jgi:hypothetical protein
MADPVIHHVINAAGLVVNSVLWDGNTKTWSPPEGHRAVPDNGAGAGIGHTFDGKKFIAPVAAPVAARTAAVPGKGKPVVV